MSTNHIDLESLGSDPELIRKNRRINSVATTYTEAAARDRAGIEQAVKAGLTLSANALLRAGYADEAKAAFTELNNQKDN